MWFLMSIMQENNASGYGFRDGSKRSFLGPGQYRVVEAHVPKDYRHSKFFSCPPDRRGMNSRRRTKSNRRVTNQILKATLAFLDPVQCFFLTSKKIPILVIERVIANGMTRTTNLINKQPILLGSFRNEKKCRRDVQSIEYMKNGRSADWVGSIIKRKINGMGGVDRVHGAFPNYRGLKGFKCHSFLFRN